MSNSPRTFLISLLLIAAGAILFLPFLGEVHLFDWDEINFAECAREMIVAKQYFLVTIDYLPFWEKPPLFIWMQVLSMKLFGITDYAARFPNAICGIATLLLIYHAGKTWKDHLFGLLWVLTYVGSILPFFYFKSGIIDPWFNFFIFSGIYCFARLNMHLKNLLPGNSYVLSSLSALCLGLAVMTKGPVALLVFILCLTVYWVLNKFGHIIKFGNALLFALVFTIVGGAWFTGAIITGHLDTIIEFIQYQVRLFGTPDSGHGGPFYYHVVVLLFGCFPASIFAIRGMLLKDTDEKFKEATKWMAILFWVVLILFSIVKTKIVHYSSLCYYPLSFFAAFAAYKLIYEGYPWKKWMSLGLIFTGGIFAILLTGLPIVGIYKQVLLGSGIIKDSFAVGNLQADVSWTYLDCIPGGFLLLSIITCIILFAFSKLKPGIIGLFLVTLITSFAVLAVCAPKIEQYTQQAAIDFYQSLKGKNVYVETKGYKSYAQYFYFEVQPWTDVRGTDIDWLIGGTIDKPAYVVCKVTQADEVEKLYPQLKELYRKNGFVFLLRPNTTQ